MRELLSAGRRIRPWRHARDGARAGATIAPSPIVASRLKALYEGWSADELLDEEACGPDGQVISEVEDFIAAVIAQPAYGYGYGTDPIGLPYYADNYDPYTPYYDL